MQIKDIETPALVVHKKALEYNMSVMDEILKDSNMKLYPHYKSHKCPELAKLQMSRGAAGITVAKLSEAEDVAECGIKNIIIANEVVQKEKLPKLAGLAKNNDITVCVDNEQNVLDIEEAMAACNATVKILVECEVGMHRCGVETKEEFLALAKLIEAQPHLEFDGIQAYAGHLSHEINEEYRKEQVERIESIVRDLKKYAEDNSINVNNICGGSTGFAEEKPKDTVYTQFQAGSYLFMDSTYNMLRLKFKQSLFLLTSVISTKKNRIVVDAGVKSVTMDQNPPYFIHFPEALIRFSEEHMALSVEEHQLKPGDKLFAIPGHCCTNINVFDKIYLIDDTEVLAELEIKSRGKAPMSLS